MNRIILPLDVSSTAEALAIVRRLRGRVALFKVGLQLFCSEGPEVVRRVVAEGCEVFLDLKLHDIPNTVGAAVGQCGRLGATLIDVHLAGGESMLRAAVAARDALPLSGAAARPRLLGITVLTSLDQGDLAAAGVQRDLKRQVVELALMGRRAGLDGVVASPHEIAPVKEACGPDFLVVTPGIRPASSAAGDQKRFMTPAEAVGLGADYLVIGRPILEAPDPAAAVESMLKEIPA